FALARAGAGPGDAIGLALPRSPELAIAVLAVAAAGAAAVPFDPSYPAERLAFMAADARLALLLTVPDLAGVVPPGVARVVRWADLESEAAEPEGSPAVARDGLLYVLYTSGSTGRPKGVGFRHGALANLIAWQLEREEHGRPLRTLQFAALSFDVSFQELYATWGAGGALVLVADEVRRDAAALLALLEERAVERLFLPFVALQQIAEAAADSSAPAALALRRVVTALALSGDPAAWPRLPSIGRPVAGLFLYIAERFDAAAAPSTPAGIGQPGELLIGGAGLARGYLARPELTAERFVPDGFSASASGGLRLFRSGDLARFVPNGEIEFLGRADQQVKVRGFRVEPGEVEAALAAHPSVRAAAVVSRPARSGGHRLVAYVAIPPGSVAPFPGALLEHLRGRLPEHMVPAAWVELPELPLTPSGKVDRRALPQPSERAESADVAPGTPSEEIVAGLFAEVLGLPGERRVGAEDGFFALGGHSLLATQLASRVRRAFGVELPLAELFDHPTVAGLAARLDARRGAGTELPPLAAGPRPEVLPLSFAQERLWFLDRLDPGSATYNVGLRLAFAGPLDVPLFAAAVAAIAARHEPLRTRFPERNGEPCQEILPAAPLPLPAIDFAGLPVPRRGREAERVARGAGRRPFDLARGPVLRLQRIALGGSRTDLLVLFHHIATRS